MANITRIACTLKGSVLSVAATWDTAETGQLTVYDAGGTAVNGAATGSGNGYINWQPASGAMTADQPYWAVVMISQVPSTKIPLLWSPVSEVASLFNGQSVSVSWKAPGGFPQPGSYTLSLTDGTQTQIVTSPSNKVSFVPSLSLATGDSWGFTITPTLGVSSGPAIASTIVTSAVAVSAVACTAVSDTTGQISITPASAGTSKFVVTLSQNGSAILVQPMMYTPGTLLKLALPAGLWPLSPAGGYSVSLQVAAGTSTGPGGAGLPIVVTAPVIAQVNVNGDPKPTLDIRVVLPPGQPPVTGFSAVLMNAALAAGSATFNGDSGTLALVSGLTTGTYTLTVSALIGTNSSGPTVQSNVLTSTATLTGIDNDAGQVSVSFTPAPDSTMTQVNILVGNTVVTIGQASTSPLILPAPDVPFSVSVQGSAAGLQGPVTGPVTAISQAPLAQGAVYGLTGVATLTWAALAANANLNGYQVEVHDGGKQTGSSSVTGAEATSTTLSASSLLAAGQISAQVRATGNAITTGTVLYGPRSVAVPVLTNAPTQVSTTYNGAQAVIEWNAPTGTNVEGYVVSLIDSVGGVAPVTRRVAGTSVSMPYTATPNSVVTVYVQTTGANAQGPAATAGLFTTSLFPSTSTQSALYLAPSASLNFGRQPLGIYLPDFFKAPLTGELPKNDSFVLGTTTTSPWKYLLQVKQTDNVWSFDASAIRSGMLTDITDFMGQMIDQGLTPQGDLLLRQVFARVLPMTYVETLFYAYNFNVADDDSNLDPAKGRGLVDLTPGLSLHVEVQSYESLPVSTPSGNAGMVGNATFDFDIHSYRYKDQWRQGFEGFLSRLVGHGVIFPGPSGGQTDPTQTGAGGSPDLYYANFLQPYYRLIYPPDYLPSQDVSVTKNLRSNVTLIAATTRKDLDDATKNLRTPSDSYKAVNAVYFRGRTLISPRIHVVFNGTDTYVALGTTVANLLERYASLNAAGGRCGQLTMKRSLGGVAIENWPATRSVPIRLDWTGGATWGDGSTWLDLPLLHGDCICLDLD